MGKVCVIIPTYNNGKTIADIVTRVHAITPDIIVVNDGSTDHTHAALHQLPFIIHRIEYGVNRGKGYALKQGFRMALALGYDDAITIDSDGQHFPEDIPLLLREHEAHPEALIVGVRQLTADSTQRRNTFANRFSNFWFTVQTLRHVADTQSGYRLYPLRRVSRRWIFSSRYEAELSLLVVAAWMDVAIRSVNVRVYYPPQAERVTHFRPAVDFTRISLLNTALCLGSLFFYLPKLILYNGPRTVYKKLFHR